MMKGKNIARSRRADSNTLVALASQEVPNYAVILGFDPFGESLRILGEFQYEIVEALMETGDPTYETGLAELGRMPGNTLTERLVNSVRRSDCPTDDVLLTALRILEIIPTETMDRVGRAIAES